MEQFRLFFKLGTQHIIDIYSVDHILFLMALSVIFLLKDWKRVVILIASFSVGHSITMVLAVMDIFNYNENLMMFLMPMTILLTGISNLLQGKENYNIYKYVNRNYFLALIFGLIHGFDFANYLKGMLAAEPNIVRPLIAFNLGIQAGQIVIVSLFLLISTIFIGTFNFNRRDWVMVISSAIAGIAITMMFESKYW